MPVPVSGQPVQLWTGKQLFGLLMRPNSSCPVKANLRTKGKAYTSGEELCINDSCKSALFARLPRALNTFVQSHLSFDIFYDFKSTLLRLYFHVA